MENIKSHDIGNKILAMNILNKFLIAAFVCVLAVGCSSDDGISGDSGESTILTGKKIKGKDFRFLLNENGNIRDEGGFDFETYDPFIDDELDEMKDLNGDGRLNCEVKLLTDKFPAIKKHVKEVTAYTDYEISGDVEASNAYYTFTFGKSKGTLTKKYCEFSFKKGDRLKLEKYDVQFNEKNVTESFDGYELSITADKIRLKAKDWETNNGLRQYKSYAYFNDHIYDFRGVKKNWIEEKTDFAYSIEGSYLIIESEGYTFSGTIDKENRNVRLKQTYPNDSKTHYWDIEF